jgi:hypothetical protein
MDGVLLRLSGRREKVGDPALTLTDTAVVLPVCYMGKDSIFVNCKLILLVGRVLGVPEVVFRR